MRRAVGLAVIAALAPTGAWASEVTYRIDPNHTHPSFEVDHFDGLSIWRGLFKSARGTITLDRERSTGTVDVTIDTASLEMGHEKLNQIAVGAKIGDWNGLNVEQFPTATYKGKLTGFVNGAPTLVDGELTLHGVTKPVQLAIASFKCIPVHPISGKEVCGADATASFSRADFGVNAGTQYGYRQGVLLRIQVEAVRQN